MFGDLLEHWDILQEKRSKAQQIQGLSRMTRHIGAPNYPEAGYVEKHVPPKRTRPAPKKGWDPHPSNVRIHKRIEKEASSELARGVGGKARKDSGAARAIRALRAIRDTPTKRTQRKAMAARRLPARLPRDT